MGKGKKHGTPKKKKAKAKAKVKARGRKKQAPPEPPAPLRRTRGRDGVVVTALRLPEVYRRILSVLEPADLMRASMVCKDWDEPSVWQAAYAVRWGDGKPVAATAADPGTVQDGAAADTPKHMCVTSADPLTTVSARGG